MAKPHAAKPTCYDRLHAILVPSIGEPAFAQWLHAKNASIGGVKPIDLIIDGKCNEAVEVANARLGGVK